MFYRYKVGEQVMSPGPDGLDRVTAAYSTEALVRRAVEC